MKTAPSKFEVESLMFEEKSQSADGSWRLVKFPFLWTQEKNAGQAQDDADDLPGQQNVFLNLSRL